MGFHLGLGECSHFRVKMKNRERDDTTLQGTHTNTHWAAEWSVRKVAACNMRAKMEQSN